GGGRGRRGAGAGGGGIVRTSPPFLPLRLQFRESVFEFRDPLLQRWQLTKNGGRLEPVTIGNGWIPRNHRSCIDGVRYTGLCGGHDAFANSQVTGHTHLSRQYP